MKYILGFLFLMLFGRSFGQDFNKTQIDSLLLAAEKLDRSEYPYAVTLSLKAYDESKKINYLNGMVEGLLIASRKQYELGEFEDVLKNSGEAEKLAKNLQDVKYYADAIRLKGISQSRLGNYKSGRTELNKALAAAKLLSDSETRSSRVGVIYNDIAFTIDQSKGSLDSVAFFYGKAYQEFEKMVLSNSLKNKTLSLACSNVGSSYLRAKELDSAQFYLERALQLANAANHKVVSTSALNDLGTLHYYKKEYNTSISVYLKGIRLAKETQNDAVLKSLYLGISKSYAKSNDNINSEKYRSLYVALSEKLQEEGKLSQEEQQLLAKEKQLFNQDYSNSSLLLFLAALVIVLIGAFFLFRKKKTEPVEEIEPNPALILAMNFEENNLKKLVGLAAEDNPSFMILFKEAFPDFFKKINVINPKLIASEQKLCALLKLDATTKEIALYTKSSVRAVESKKYRLRKKLDIPTKMDMNIWMGNL